MILCLGNLTGYFLKNINRKLEIRNLKDILEYTYAFDLV